MRAVCAAQKPTHPPQLCERDATPLAPGHVLLRATHLLAHPTAAPPGRVLGCWGVGVVERLGTGVTLTPGQRVAIAQSITCGQCERCRHGLAQHCVRRATLGRDVDGLWSEACVVPASCVAPLSRALTPEAACLANPLAMVLHAARHVAIAKKPFVTVLGDGVHALLAGLVLTRQNASVRLLSQRDETLALADRLAIKHRATHEAGQRADQDVVLDATAMTPTRDPAFPPLAPALLRPRGAWILLAGEPATTPTTDVLAAIASLELSVHGVTHPGPVALAEALALLETAGLDTAPLTAKTLGFWDVASVHAAWQSLPHLPMLLRA